MKIRLFALLALITSLLSGCGYNQVQTNDEAVNSAWSEVLNQYQRRADLVPNLVAIVPQLKADANFRDLQAQVEGTENRITVARNRYIKAVQEYNVSVRTFPNNLTAMVMGWKTKANFAVDNEKAISTAPKIDFNAPKPAAAK